MIHRHTHEYIHTYIHTYIHLIENLFGLRMVDKMTKIKQMKIRPQLYMYMYSKLLMSASRQL